VTPPEPADTAPLPPCGLYRTTQALPASDGRLLGQRLVFFHANDGENEPEVRLPQHHFHNRWRFPAPGLPIDDLAWVRTMVRLPREGFFSLRQSLVFDGGQWPRGALVQLGFTREAEPVLFIAQRLARREANDLFFADQGVAISLEQLILLEPLVVAADLDDDGDERCPRCAI
jgi:hypothetical protein